MRRPLSVQVEPLTPQRWSKIERGLFARWEAGDTDRNAPAPPRVVRRWRARWWAVAAGLLIAGAAFGSAARHFSGEGVRTPQASRIATGRSGSRLALRELTLDVDPESVVVVGEASEHGMLVVLDRGSIVCEVAPRPAAQPLIVQAGEAQIRVIGTRFRVERRGEAARVKVEHGAVDVAFGGRVTRVTAGQAWPPQVAPPSVLREEVAPVTATPSAVATQGSSPRRHEPRSRASVDLSAELSQQERFERAAALERTAPDAALAIYRSLETNSDSWAANALFAHARLEAARGNSREAVQLLERYSTRFPKGANRGDARALLDRLR